MIVKSLEHLNSISKKVADKLEESDYIYLIGEIGAGKTTFTRFLINYLQKKESLKVSEVLSPTFNLLYEYDFRNYKIMHYDLYRLTKERELIDLGLFSDNKKAIKIIEWPTLINTPIFDKLEVHIDYFKNKQRKINLIGTGKWKKFK